MQRSFVAIATSTVLLTLGVFSLSSQAGMAQRQPGEPSPVIRLAAVPSLAGQFVAAEHPTTGEAKIVTENGQRYLEFDSAFRSDDGPDLLVLLHRDRTPSDYNESNYVSLGRLQSTNGKQRYAIPTGVSVNDFQSAVIWCRAFNATFGFAPLG